jgi:hypothetical protein
MDALNSAVPVEPGSADGLLRAAPNASRGYKVGNYARAAHDWYVEPRWCVEQLADAVDFAGHTIWDPCAGGGTIPDTFAARDIRTLASDVVERRPNFLDGIHDATAECAPIWLRPGVRLSVVTNPPFKMAEQITRRMLALADHRVCVLQQLSFLASAARHRLFTEFPPSDVLILSRRPSMPPGAMIEEMGAKAFKGGTTDFCWIVWTKPHDRETRTRWLSPKVAA